MYNVKNINILYKIYIFKTRGILKLQTCVSNFRLISQKMSQTFHKTTWLHYCT